MSNVIDLKEQRRERHDHVAPVPYCDKMPEKTRIERIYEVRRGDRVVTVRHCSCCYFWMRARPHWITTAGWGRNVQRHSKTKHQAVDEAWRLLDRAERADERKRLDRVMAEARQ